MSDLTKEVKFKISLQKGANVEEAILAIKKALTESEREYVKFNSTVDKSNNALVTATTKSAEAVKTLQKSLTALQSTQPTSIASPLIRDFLAISSSEESLVSKRKATLDKYSMYTKMFNQVERELTTEANAIHSQALRDNAAIDQKEIARQRERTDVMRKLLAEDLNTYNAYANATRAAKAKASEVADSVGSTANDRLASARAASEREIALARYTADSIEGIKLRQSIRLEEIEARTQSKILEYQRRAAEASLTGNNRLAALIPGNIAATVTSNVTQTNRVNDTAAQEIASLQARTRAYEDAQRQMLSAMNSRIQMEQIILQHGANSEQAIVQRSVQEQARLREELRARIVQINSTATPNTYVADQTRIAEAMRVTERAINANNVATRDQINTLRELSPHGNTGGSLLSFIAQWGLGWRVVNSVINAVSSAIRSIPTAGIEMQSTISTLHASFSNNQDGTRNTPQGEALTAIAMTKIQEEAKRTGIALTTLEGNYRTFLASAHMAGESTATVNTIFRDLDTVITALHMSGDRAQLTFLALSQMFNKGKVQSEELTKQLGNLLPGAFAAFAKATGRTTQQLTQDMKAGTVTAHENIAKFIAFYASQYGDAFGKASAGLNAELGRLSSAWTNFSRGVFGGTGDMMADTVRGLTSLVESVTVSGAQMEKFGQQVKSVGIAFGAAGIAGAIAVIVSSPMILGLTAVAVSMAAIAKAIGMITDAKERDAKIGYRVQGVDDTYSGQSVEDQLKNKAAAIAKVTSQRNTLTNNKLLFTPEETSQIEKLNHTLQMLGLQYTALGQKVTEYEAINNTTAEFDSEMTKEHDAITKAIYPEVAAYEKLIATLGNLQNAQKLVVESNAASMERWSKDPNTHVGVTALPELKSDVLAPGESDTILADAHQKLLQKATTELETQQEASNDRRKALLDENLSNIKDNAAKQVSATEALNSDLQDKFNSGLLGLEEYIARSKKLSDEKVKAQLEANRQAQATLNNELDLVVSSVQDKSPRIGLEIDDSKLSKAVLKYKDLIENASRNTGVSSGLIAAVMQTESAGNPNAFSSANARGLMQTLPATYLANGGAPGKIFDPEENINAGAKYLARLTDYFEKLGLQGEKLLTYTIAAYNAGAGNKGTSRIDRALNGNDSGFAETRAYVPKVLSHLSDTVSEGRALKDTVDLQNKLNKAKADEVGLIADATKEESKRREETRKLYLDDIKAQADKFKPITLPSTFGNEVKDSAETFSQEIMDGMQKQGAVFIAGWKATILAAGTAVRDEYNRIHEAIPVAERQLAQDKNNGVVDSAGYERAKIAIQGMRDSLPPLLQSLTDLGEANKIAGKTAEDWSEQQTKAVNEVIGVAEKQLNREISRATMSDSQAFIEEKRNQLRLRGVEIGVKEEAQLQHLLTLQKQLLAVQQEQAVISSIKNGFVQGFKDILSGASDFGTAFKKIFDDAVNVILNNSLQNLVNGVQNAFNSLRSGGSVDWGSIGTSLVQVGASALVSWLQKSPEKAPSTIAQVTTNKNILGQAQMSIADTGGRGVYTASSLESMQRFNSALDSASSLIRQNSSVIVDYASTVLTKVVNMFGGSSLIDGFNTLASKATGLYDSLASYGSQLVGGIKSMIPDAINSLLSSGTSISLSGISGGTALVNGLSTASSSIATAITPTLTNAVSTAATTATQAAISNSITPAFQSVATTAAASTTSFASAAQASSAASGASSAAGASTYLQTFGQVLAIVKLGFDLASIAGQKYSTTMEKVSQSFYAAESASWAFLTIPIVGWIAGAVLHVLGVVTEGLSGDLGRSFSNGFGGQLGAILFDSFIKKDPSTTMLSMTSPDTKATKVNDSAGDYYTSSGGKSGSVGIDGPFGQMWLRINEVSRKSGLMIEEAVKAFLPLLKTTQAFDRALATSIQAVDRTFGQDTLSKFKIATEYEQPLASLDSSKFISQRLTDIAKGLGETGTKAGDAVATWWNAFSSKLLDPTKGTSYNTATSFNIEAFLALELPKLVQLPKKLADLFVQSVTSVADGATQEQFTGQMNDFFAGWEYASNGLAKLGVEIQNTALPEYLTSLVGIGMTVKDSAAALVIFGQSFIKAGTDATEAFNTAFNGMFDVAKAKGYNKEETAGFVGSEIVLASTSKELGLNVSATDLSNLASSLNDLAITSTDSANGIIDQAIATAGLGNKTREAAIQHLALTGALTSEQIAAASFSKALVEQQKIMFDGISAAQDSAIFLGTSLGNMGLSFVDVANIGVNITNNFKDLASAMSFLDNLMKKAFSPEEYASRKKDVAARQFSSAAKNLGYGDNYSTDSFGSFLRDGGDKGYAAQLFQATAKGDSGRVAQLEVLGSAYDVLTTAETNYVQAVQSASSSVDKTANTAADNAKKLADIVKGIDEQLYSLSHTEIENKLHAVQVEMEALAASAAEAGGSLSNLDTLSKAKLGKIAEDWTKPLLESFSQLGKSDLQNTLEGIGTRFGLLEKEAATLASQGLVDLSVALSGLNSLKLAELQKALNPLATELQAIGKTKFTLSAEGIEKTYKELLAVSDTIATAYGVDGQTAIGWINQIRNARIAALQEEHTKIMQDAADANTNFQGYKYKQDAPDAAGLSNSLLTLKSGLLANITSLIQAGGSYSDTMKLISYATTVGVDQIASAQANIAARYKGIFNTVQSASDAMAKMAIQAKFSMSANGQTNQAELDKQLAAYDTQVALKQLHDEDFNVQMSGMNTLISLQQSKFDKEKSALQSTIDFVKTLKDYVKDLLLNANLSPLTNKQRLDEAQKQAYDTFNAASSSVDDKTRQDARSQLTAKASAYLTEAKAYYASSPEYAKIFNEVTGALNNFGDVTVDPQKQLVDLNSQMLLALFDGNNMLSVIRDAQTAKQQAESKSIPIISQGIIDGFNDSFEALLKKFNLTPAMLENSGNAITALTDKVLVGLGELVAANKLSQSAKDSIIVTEKAFLDGALAYYKAGTLTQEAYTSVVTGRETLNLSIINGYKAGTLSAEETKTIYDARNTVSDKLYTFLANAQLSPENLNTVIEGFGTLSANAGYMLAGVSLTGPQIALISKGYEDSVKGVGATIGMLGLTAEDKKWYEVGTGIFSQNVGKDVGNITTPSEALTTVEAGINKMAERVQVGLSDIMFLKPAGDMVLLGINTLAFNISNGLIHITDGVDPSPITNAINILMANVASMIVTQQAVATAAPSAPTNFYAPTSSTPGLDAILRGDMATAGRLATASGLFKQEDIAGFLSASRSDQLAVFDRLPKFANGGIANSQSMYVAGEVREAIIPIPSGSVRAQITEPRQVGLTKEELAQEVAKLIKELQRSAGSNEEGQDATIIELSNLKDAVEVLNNKIERILSE